MNLVTLAIYCVILIVVMRDRKLGKKTESSRRQSRQERMFLLRLLFLPGDNFDGKHNFQYQNSH